MSRFLDLINPFDGSNPVLDYAENLVGAIIPGQQGEDDDVSILGSIGAGVGDFLGGPIGGMIGAGLGEGANNLLGRGGQGGAAPGGYPGCPPMDCYSKCSLQAQMQHEETKKKVAEFLAKMEQRGLVGVRCNVPSTAKSCRQRAAPCARKSPCSRKSPCARKKKSCGCSRRSPRGVVIKYKK